MNGDVAVLNASHNTFSTSSNNVGSNNIYPATSSPFSPNMILRFQHFEGLVSTSDQHHELPLLKRKRPNKISVPAVARLSSLLDVEATPRNRVERMEELEVEGDGYGAYCKRGRSRATMEDRYAALVNNVQDNSKQAFFGIFDGHGGVKAAEFAASRLGENILDQVCQGESKTMEEKIRDGYLATDAEFLRCNANNGGTCCITAFIQDRKLVVSNLGDCRAVISKGGLAEQLTLDHTPSRADEKTRIEAKGGYVDCYNGVWRVQGSLAVSRAIGDRHLKQWVTAEPETKIVDMQPDFQFLILASDGLWDKVTNQEAVDTVLPFCTAVVEKSELTRACRKLVELSISRGSSDDTSVMIIQLGRFC